MSRQTTKIGLMFAGTLIGAHAQWLNYPAAGTPRTRDGKPNLSAKAPRAANGKPDLSGVWLTEYSRPGENGFNASLNYAVVPGDNPGTFSKYVLNILADFKPEESPMRPEAAEILRARSPAQNPSAHCLPHSVARADIHSYAPFKIVQTTGLMIFLYEIDGTHRQVYTDGRKLPKDPQPSWLGYSVGRWEGDTLVVETTGFNGRSWTDTTKGRPQSDAARVIERFRRPDFGHLQIEITIDDPKTYEKPWTAKVPVKLLGDTDLIETYCENEKDRP